MRLLFIIQPHLTGATHRLPVVRGAARAGYKVSVATQKNSPAWVRLHQEGFDLIPIRMSRFDLNPVKDIATLYDIGRAIRRLKPDIVNTASIKPVIYGGIANRFSFLKKNKRPALVSLIPGVGSVFTIGGLKTRCVQLVVSILYRFAFGNERQRIIFQNTDDMQLLLEKTGVPSKDVSLIFGSGVNLDSFPLEHEESSDVKIFFIGRMLRAKGVAEFAGTARRLRSHGFSTRFVLVGGTDVGNPNAVPEETLRQWVSEGILEWWGEVEDVHDIYKKASVIVLPSYREGLPKVILEAAASGLPVVASDVPGCREAVLDRKTGFLVPLGDVKAIAYAIRRLVEDSKLRRNMGAEARRFAEECFAEEHVVNATLEIYKGITHQRSNSE